MKTFAHYSPETLKEASELLVAHRGAGRVNAGGTDLLGVLKDDIHPEYPEALISLKRIPGLDAIELREGELSIGCMARIADLARVADDGFALIRQAARSVAGPQIRAVGTAGGNLCQEVRCWYYRYPRHIGGPVSCLRKGGKTCPAVKGDNRYHAIMAAKRCFAVCPSDLAVALAALDATVLVSGPGGTRTQPIADLYTNLGTVLDQGDILTEIRVPRPPAEAWQRYRKMTVRKSIDFALVSVAVVLSIEDGACTAARIALGGVAPIPLRAKEAEETLLGRPLDEETVSLAARAAVAAARPLRRNAYKVSVAKALIRETLLASAASAA